MTTTTLYVENGEIILADDRISIQDKAQREKMLLLGSGIFLLLYGVNSLWSFQNSGDSFEQSRLWIGALSVLLALVQIGRILRQSTACEIPLDTIKQFRFQSNMLGDETLVLKLNNGLRRTIRVSAPVTNDLQTYFSEKGL